MQFEASVAVIVVRVGVFRALFVAHQVSKDQEQLPYHTSKKNGSPKAMSKVGLLWSRKSKPSTQSYTINKSDRNKGLPAPPNHARAGIIANIRQSPLSSIDRICTGYCLTEFEMDKHDIVSELNMGKNTYTS